MRLRRRALGARGAGGGAAVRARAGVLRVPVRGVHVPPGHEHHARLDADVPQGRRRERVRAPALLQAAGRLRRDRVSRVGPAQAEPSEDGQAVRLRAPLAVAGRADRRHSGLDQRHRAQAIEAGVRRTTPGPRVLGVKSDSTYKVLDRIARAYSEKRFLVVYENARYRTTSTRDTQRRSTKGVRRRHLFTPPSRKARARPWP